MGEIFPQEKARDVLPFTGERFTSAESGQIEIEHLHRYFLARHLCRGCDVLDVASGEGYGTAMLAQVARTVIGVDTAADAVAHATGNYDKPNLSFRLGDATALPVKDGTLDRVVTFETVEHLTDQETFLREIKRVLRPDGTVIMSTPDRDIYSPPDQPSNPHHLHELTRREFYDLMRRHFRHVRFFAQRPLAGSAIISDEPQPHADLPAVYEARGDRIEESFGLPRATYLICIASDAELPPPPESFYIHTGDLGSLFGTRDQLLRLQHMIEENALLHAANTKLLADNKTLQRYYERFSRDNHYVNLRNWDLAEKRTTDRQRIVDQQGELNRLKYDIALERLQIARELDRVANELRLRDEAIAEKHTAAQHEMAWRDAKITALHAEIDALTRHAAALEHGAADLHRHYYAEVLRLRRRSLRTLLRERVRRRPRLARIVAALHASPLFDGAWYLAKNPDVGESKQDPAMHYALAGADEGRDPGPDFDTTYYLHRYPDAIASELTALEHYERHGRFEGRQTRAPAAPTPPAGPAVAQHEALPVAAPPPPAPEPDARAEPDAVFAPEAPAAPARTDGIPHIVFLSGEHKTAGHIYRVLRYAEAARELGCTVTVLTVAEAGGLPRIIETADLVVIWRAPGTT